MFILNKKTGIVQECHNNDAIKACRKDTECYAVSEKREDLVHKEVEKAQKVTKDGKTDDSSANTTSGTFGGNENTKDTEGKADGGQKTVVSEIPDNLDEEKLKAMDWKDIRGIAKAKGIPGYSNMNKETLIAMILNY